MKPKLLRKKTKIAFIYFLAGLILGGSLIHCDPQRTRHIQPIYDEDTRRQLQKNPNFYFEAEEKKKAGSDTLELPDVEKISKVRVAGEIEKLRILGYTVATEDLIPLTFNEFQVSHPKSWEVKDLGTKQKILSFEEPDEEIPVKLVTIFTYLPVELASGLTREKEFTDLTIEDLANYQARLLEKVEVKWDEILEGLNNKELYRLNADIGYFNQGSTSSEKAEVQYLRGTVADYELKISVLIFTVLTLPKERKFPNDLVVETLQNIKLLFKTYIRLGTTNQEADSEE